MLQTLPEVVKGPEQLAEMPEEYRELLLRQMMVHAEGELSGADDYALLLYPIAPNSYEKKVCLDRSVEELDHYQKAADILVDMNVDVSHMLDQKLGERSLYATEAVQHISTWPERGLFAFLGEGAVVTILEEWLEHSYLPVREMAPSVLAEERMHQAHGFRIVREYSRDHEGKNEVQKALNKWWAISLDLFGPSNSRKSPVLVKYGLRKKTNEQARQDYIKRMAPRLEELGFTVPDEKEGRKFI
jgi:ring-1,2-phenylacetyl-CoA epoxidase subunit PaaA